MGTVVKEIDMSFQKIFLQYFSFIKFKFLVKVIMSVYYKAFLRLEWFFQ